ncbi:MAG: glycosyltransferase family 2 protein [Cyanobacteria bacterium P01_H01_bin.74]
MQDKLSVAVTGSPLEETASQKPSTENHPDFMPTYKTVSILIPVFNEVNSLEALLAKLAGVDFCGLKKEWIIVDDGSNDGTRAILERLKAEGCPSYLSQKIIFHEHNKGKGAALRTAIQEATGDIIVIQDADLEYDPADYPALIEKIIAGEADVVYGSRFQSRVSQKAFAGLHYWGNKLLTQITNLLFGAKITDMETCYKAFKPELIKTVKIRSDRFDFEPEITAKVLKQGCKIVEVPISYHGRQFHEGKKITWLDGLFAIKALIRFRFFD